MSADECEVYGSNETGGMKPTRTGWFFYRILPPKYPTYTVVYTDDDGLTRYKSEWPRQRVRDFARRIPGLRGPWFVDHCHHFKEDTDV